MDWSWEPHYAAAPVKIKKMPCTGKAKGCYLIMNLLKNKC